MQRRRVIGGKFHGRAFVGICEGVETLRLLLALPIDDQVASDREEPSLEPRPTVVLMTALQNAYPRLLEEIFGALAVPGDVDEIAEQAVLILLDQCVEQLRVTAFQPQG